MKSLLHLLGLLILLAMNFSPEIYAQDEPDEIGSFVFEGLSRNYEVYLPQNFQLNMPLVINLHGYFEETEWYKDYTIMHEIADTAGYITVYPASKYPSWNTGEIPPPEFFPYDSTINDVGFISALIDTLHQHYAIDLSRIYCCGFSSGGIMAFKLAVELRHRFAAVASVNGPAIEPFLKMSPLQPIPILFIHGTDDAYISYETPHGNLMSAKNTLDYWIESNNCSSHSDTTSLPDLDLTDGAIVEKITYENCLGDSTVVHYKIIGGGHNWPGAEEDWDGEGNKCMDINASVEILKFFNNYENPLVNLAFARSREVHGRYLDPDGDTLIVSAHLSNPDNHPASVTAFIEGKSSAFQDSIQLFDDGLHRDGEPSDNIFGGVKWMATNAEDMFGVTFQTSDDQLEMTTHIPYPLYFTTIGPVVADSVSLPFLSNNRIGFDVYLRNAGLTVTADGIRATIYPDATHPCFVSMGLSRLYGDIDAGQKIKKTFSMEIDLSCAEDSIITIPFDIDIESSGVIFWTDHAELVIDLKALDIKEPLGRLPAEFSLEQNYPNPFNPTTAIGYQLSAVSDVELSIYNSLGQKITMLVNEQQNAGIHQVEWDASGFASGVYYYRIQTDEFVDVKKMILLR